MARILIVDDDHSDRLLQQSILEGAGHTTFTAKDGAEALVKYGKLGIELVVTDLRMPSFGGLELIEVLTRLTPRPMIVVISALDEGELEKARAGGADVTLRKPITADGLLSAIGGLEEARTGLERAKPSSG